MINIIKKAALVITLLAVICMMIGMILMAVGYEKHDPLVNFFMLSGMGTLLSLAFGGIIYMLIRGIFEKDFL